MEKATFSIPKMDCSAEEQLVRMKLDGEKAVKKLDFDLSGRQLTVFHEGDTGAIDQQLRELNLGSKLLQTEDLGEVDVELSLQGDTVAERRLLWIVFAINFGFFVLEIVTGFIADSMGLVADSLDMLADAFIFAMSLFVVGKAVSSKKKVAAVSGYLQLALAVYGMIEVIRRFAGHDETPNYQIMIAVSAFALAGNALTLYLLYKAKNKEAHIQAGSIFISNDVVINAGVIVAGILVYLVHSRIPDLVIGTIVFVIVGFGAFRILKLAKP
ncbi:cation transporter [Mucilaginibacter rubeus]|uniref:Cation transporter n=1 Tax=Mucilaginibacter rubeus TaxID=2027860 RepID=A0AAE6JJW1_9SPHI|nr:cation transporter [Mucilaginibacter rubeus]QEM07079.1 cation transporter [Mucilaginibacter rubeus]QTE43778.1 cation transporter [Mucilaginibacter rubeus]QTE50377.1 cation transporter [Mucilaginibacter rubeus]QTE55464.1 cation transporter [Mucilaginibacter rubeus]QTE65074.1 cation transporter [Mucilaginibacter rubeus]